MIKVQCVAVNYTRKNVLHWTSRGLGSIWSQFIHLDDLCNLNSSPGPSFSSQ